MHGPMRGWRVRIALALSLLLAACNNSPYPDGAAATNTIFNSFDERSPRYLDPTASYSNPETPYTYSAYEPLYAYHYLKRPYVLIPKTAEEVAKPHYLDKAGQPLPDDAAPEQIDGAPMRDEDITSMMLVILFGGLDTVASTMSFLMHHLATHPELRRQDNCRRRRAAPQRLQGISYYSIAHLLRKRGYEIRLVQTKSIEILQRCFIWLRSLG